MASVATALACLVVARMGGDEFAVLLERADVEAPEVVAQRIVYRLRAPVDIDGKAIVTQGSVGVAMASTTTTSAEELLRNADLAMYAAKSKGKGVYEIYERQMHAAALERVELEADLSDALRRRELTLHYQPVVELPSGRVSGVEALARWEHPLRGTMSPAEFVPLAEESGLVVDLGRWVLGEACREGRRFQQAYPTEPPFAMAVNVAARQLTSPWLVDEVRRALSESHFPASSLVLEITEGALMRDASSIVPTLHALRALGVRLAIDDFGTGWSSLSRLRSFPVDKLIIDRSFTSEITSSSDDAPIVAAIVAMAHSLQLTTVAEGVETSEQLACLHEHGCEEVQGYLPSRPLPPDRLLDLLAEPGGLLGPAATSDGGLSAAERSLMGLVGETTRRADGRERVRPGAARAGAGDGRRRGVPHRGPLGPPRPGGAVQHVVRGGRRGNADAVARLAVLRHAGRGRPAPARPPEPPRRPPAGSGRRGIGAGHRPAPHARGRRLRHAVRRQPPAGRARRLVGGPPRAVRPPAGRARGAYRRGRRALRRRGRLLRSAAALR